MSSIKHKNALVTGAAKRIGSEIAIELAKNGWNVALHTNNSDASETLSKVKNLGVKAVVLKSELGSAESAKKLMQNANAELGEISLLINNASIFEKVKFAETTEDIFDRHHDIHAKAPFFLAQEFATQCKGDGHIINMVDTFIKRNNTSYFAYLLSKKSLANLSKMLAYELAPKIRVNAIMPSAVEEFKSNTDAEYLKNRKSKLPMLEFCSYTDITSAITYLANSNLTGQELYIDGGEQLL